MAGRSPRRPAWRTSPPSRRSNFPSIKEISGEAFADNLYEQIDALGAEVEIEKAVRIEKRAEGDFAVHTEYGQYEGRSVIIAAGVKHKHLKTKHDREDLVGNEKKAEGDFLVHTEYGQYEGRSVIIAAGVKHKHLKTKHEREDLVGKGVYYCAVCDGPFYKGQEVALVGDANTALQYALLLSGYCKKVYMYTLFDKFFGDANLVKARDTAKRCICIRFSINFSGTRTS